MNKDKWTKEELSLRPGLKQLAAAVIEQWHRDGEPKKDQEIIDAWIKLYNSLEVAQ